jgi:hypothetical protein
MRDERHRRQDMAQHGSYGFAGNSASSQSLGAYCQGKGQDALHAGTCHGEERGEQKFVKRWTWCRLILCILMALSTRSSIDDVTSTCQDTEHICDISKVACLVQARVSSVLARVSSTLYTTKGFAGETRLFTGTRPGCCINCPSWFRVRGRA